MYRSPLFIFVLAAWSGCAAVVPDAHVDMPALERYQAADAIDATVDAVPQLKIEESEDEEAVDAAAVLPVQRLRSRGISRHVLAALIGYTVGAVVGKYILSYHPYVLYELTRTMNVR